jgi:mannose-6-phosphate isomerase-like protein (cupin superfamily)
MDSDNPEKNLTISPPLGAVSKSNCINQYTWGDGCYGWNFVDTVALSIKQELMPPDTAEKPHYHEKANQFFFILTGKANFTIDGVQHILKPTEGIEIKAGQKHFISNKNTGDLEFILYSQPSTKNDRVNLD